MFRYVAFLSLFAFAVSQFGSGGLLDQLLHGSHHEHSEMGTMRFYYDPSSHYLTAITHNHCYLMSLDDQQQHSVHTNTGLENLELTMMAMIKGGEDTLFHEDLIGHSYELEALCRHHDFFKVGSVLTKTTTTAAMPTNIV